MHVSIFKFKVDIPTCAFKEFKSIYLKIIIIIILSVCLHICICLGDATVTRNRTDCITQVLFKSTLSIQSAALNYSSNHNPSETVPHNVAFVLSAEAPTSPR